MQPEILLAHFYRVDHDDCGYSPIPFPDDETDLEATLSEALLSRFREPRRKMKPPHTVDLIDEKGAVRLRLRVVDASTTKRAILRDHHA